MSYVQQFSRMTKANANIINEWNGMDAIDDLMFMLMPRQRIISVAVQMENLNKQACRQAIIRSIVALCLKCSLPLSLSLARSLILYLLDNEVRGCSLTSATFIPSAYHTYAKWMNVGAHTLRLVLFT